MKDTNNHTIVVINDTPDQLELMAVVLGDAGYLVLSAASAAEGLEIARTAMPDLIISDVMMSEIDGIELCRIVRRDEKLASIPVLLVSALRKDTESIVEALKTGAADYIQAPYEPMFLVAKATRLIEQKRAENVLRAREHWFRSLIENLTDVIAVLTLDGRILYQSPSLEPVLGYKPEEMVGGNAFDFIHPDDIARVSDYFRESLKKNGASEPIEYRFRHKNGSWRLLESVSQKFNDPAHGIVSIVNSRDITNQRKALEAQRESESRFRSIFDNAGIGIAFGELDSASFKINPAMERMLGYTSQEAAQMSIEEFTHPDDVEMDLSLFAEIFAGKRDYYQIEKRYIKKNGEIIWGNLTVSVIKNADGTPRFAVGMVEDITERKLTEERLRRQLDFTSAITDNMAEGICTIDRERRLTFMNHAAEEMLGWKQEEILGTNLHETVHYRKADGTPFPQDECTLMVAIAKSEPVRGYETTYIRKDGTTFDVLCSTVPLIEDGVITGAVQTFHDITERRRAQEQLDRFFNVSVDLLAFFDFDGSFIRVNPAWEKTLGYTAEELLGKKFVEFVHPEDLERTLKHSEKDFRGEKTVALENRFRCKNGAYKWLLWNSAPIQKEGIVYTVAHDITERKLTENALTKSREHLAQAQEVARVGSFELDIKTRRVVASAALESLYGAPPDFSAEFTYWDQMVHPEDRKTVRRKMFEAMRKGEVEAEFRIIRQNGEMRWTQATGKVFYDAQGKPSRLIGVNMDITERKQAENKLRFQAQLLDMVEQAVIATDLEGKVIYWNQFAQVLYGWTTAEAIGRNAMDLITPQVTHQQGEEIMRQLREGRSWIGEFTVQTKYGRTFPAYVCDSPINDDDGNLIGMVGISVDISQRKHTEKALAEANERAIREYDRLLYRLSNLSQVTGGARDLEAVFRAILEFARESVPCSALMISLYEKEKNSRRVIYMWYNGKEEDPSRLEPSPVGSGNVGRAVKSGEVVIVNDYYDYVKKASNFVYFGFEQDERMPRSTMIAPMKLMGNPVGVIEIQSYEPNAYTEEHATAMRMAANLAASAIESLRFIEQERVRGEQMQMSQKLESIGRLAGGIAHDFNNMLTAINGYSDLTLRRLKTDDPIRRNIEEIKKAGERSAALTQQLLAFSRRLVLKPKVLDLNHEVIEVSTMLKRLIGEDIQLITNLSPKLGRVEVDPGQLAQVVINLAVNARDAMPQGGMLTIETSNVFLDEDYAARHISAAPGHYVMLSVTDNGAGMDDETLRHIFEPFFTTKEVGKGTGLGLATVYGIVKQSNGYIWVYSEPGKGTSFKIYLPRVDVEAHIEENAEDAEQNLLGTETILLVEDEEVVRNLSRQILETCGYKVIEAADGSEALSIFEQTDEDIDLVMTDVVMPKMSGRQLVEHLESVSPDVKVLYMSGYTDDAIVRQGIIETGDNFIQKPFTFTALANKVRELLDAKN